VVFNALKENRPRDRKIVNFDNVCKFQRGNVIDDCCLQLNPEFVSDEKDIV